ncbi:MAG: hypothetical protein WAW92_00895 [Minisyncoccia bacterium]
MNQKFSHHEEYLKRKRRRRLVNTGLLFFTIALVLGISSYVAHMDRFRITKINLFGGILVVEDEIQKKSFEYLDSSYFWLYPKNNALIYPKKELEDFLRNNFKRIDTIDISLSGFKRMEVLITERKHFAIWCLGQPQKDSPSENCYFMDRNSTVFAPAPSFSGDAYFKYYGPIDSDNPIGHEYISSSTIFSDISGFVDFAKKMSLKPLYVVSKSDGEYEMKLANGGNILFNSKESLQKTSDNLSALLSTEALSKLDRGDLPVEYLDLRFGNKLYYKLKATSTVAE